MNWYKEAKKKSDNDEFDYSDEIRRLWQHFLTMEQDRVGIHFDLENDDGSDIKTKDLRHTNKNLDDQFRIKAKIYWAGGDWQTSTCYFRCQYESRAYYDHDKKWSQWGAKFKTIIIPERTNLNLVKGKKGMVASDADSSLKNDINDKDLWEEMVDIAEERIKSYYLEYFKQEDGGDSSYKNTGCIRNLADVKL